MITGRAIKALRDQMAMITMTHLTEDEVMGLDLRVIMICRSTAIIETVKTETRVTVNLKPLENCKKTALKGRQPGMAVYKAIGAQIKQNKVSVKARFVMRRYFVLIDLCLEKIMVISERLLREPRMMKKT